MAYKNLKPFKLGLTDKQDEALRQLSKDNVIPMTRIVSSMVDYVLASPLELSLIIKAMEFKKE